MPRPFHLSALLLGGLLSVSLSANAQAADTYKLDAAHTAVVWHISHFGFSSPSGKFMNADGSVTLDQQNPSASKVTVTIPLADMDSGVPKLDEHMKSKDFFDVATYPTATFTSDSVNVTSPTTALVSGTLTLHGIAKPIVLNVRLNKQGENMFKKQTAGFSATASLKRSDFGITTYLPGLGDDVQLDIESEANLTTANGG